MRPTSSACSTRGACGSRISGVVRCRASASTHRGSVSRRRVRPRESSFQRWPGRRPSASASSTAESVSEGNARSGARALRAGRSPSTGGSCSRHLKCWTTWSCTSSVTCESRTTREHSGRSSSDIAPTGASSAIGCATTDPSSWHSALRSNPPRSSSLRGNGPGTRPRCAPLVEGEGAGRTPTLLVGSRVRSLMATGRCAIRRSSSSLASSCSWSARQRGCGSQSPSGALVCHPRWVNEAGVRSVAGLFTNQVE